MKLLMLKPEVSFDAEYLSGHSLYAPCKGAALGRESIKSQR